MVLVPIGKQYLQCLSHLGVTSFPNLPASISRLCALILSFEKHCLLLKSFIVSRYASISIDEDLHRQKPGFHMIVTVGDTSPRQARGHIRDSCVKWKHFMNDVADQTGTVRDASKELR